MPLQPVPEDLILPPGSSLLQIAWVEQEDIAELSQTFDEEDFHWFPTKPGSQTQEAWHEQIARCTAQGIWLLVVRGRAAPEVLCLTSLMDWKPKHRGVEIGHTLVSKPHRGTWVNPTVKLALLTHAFETLNLNRVQLKAHALNLRSRKAIQKIGAQFEGILRQNTLMPDGTWRDTAYYSILAAEWPEVKKRLEELSAVQP